MTDTHFAKKPHMVKIVLLGDSGVGKTSIISRYKGYDWVQNPETTLGVAFIDKNIVHQGINLKLNIWDTAGQEKYTLLTRMYYRDANVILLVYDVTNKNSFINIKKWYQELTHHSNCNQIIYIVGNQIDNIRQVNNHDIDAMLKKIDGFHFETSAKKNIGINELFDHICDHLVDNFNLSSFAEDGRVYLSVNTKKKSKCCL